MEHELLDIRGLMVLARVRHDFAVWCDRIEFNDTVGQPRKKVFQHKTGTQASAHQSISVGASAYNFTCHPCGTVHRLLDRCCTVTPIMNPEIK